MNEPCEVELHLVRRELVFRVAVLRRVTERSHRKRHLPFVVDVDATLTAARPEVVPDGEPAAGLPADVQHFGNKQFSQPLVGSGSHLSRDFSRNCTRQENFVR